MSSSSNITINMAAELDQRVQDLATKMNISKNAAINLALEESVSRRAEQNQRLSWQESDEYLNLAKEWVEELDNEKRALSYGQLERLFESVARELSLTTIEELLKKHGQTISTAFNTSKRETQ